MAQIKSVIMLMLQPDMSEVESGRVEPFRIAIPELKFGDLKSFFDQEINAGCKIELKVANDYLDLASLEATKMSGGNIQVLLQYCATAVSVSPPKKGQAKVLDVAKAWADGPFLEDRSHAAPPRVIFLEASASSIVNMGIWIDTIQKAVGSFQNQSGMRPSMKKGLEAFFGVPFLPYGMISHQPSVSSEQIKRALRGTLPG